MEFILDGLDFCAPYIDDIIIGSTGDTEEELLANPNRDIRKVLDRLAQFEMFANPKKSHFFMREVEFCGHILREGRRSPAPGKLLALQKWELPKTVTQLRGFLGLTNYYSSYVEDYAKYSDPLTEKLKLNRHDSKKRLSTSAEVGRKLKTGF